MMLPQTDHETPDLKLLSQRYRDLGDVEAIANLASVMTYGHLAGADAHTLCEKIAGLLCKAAWDDDDPTEALNLLPKLVEASKIANGNCDLLANIDGWGPMRKAVHEVIAAPLSSVFGHACRVRIWAMDGHSGNYVGLLTLGMGPEFKDVFESENLVLSRENTPYIALSESRCLILSAETVDAFLRQKGDTPEVRKLRQFYYDDTMLGLGTIVAETYTFEFHSTDTLQNPPSTHYRKTWLDYDSVTAFSTIFMSF